MSKQEADLELHFKEHALELVEQVEARELGKSLYKSSSPKDKSEIATKLVTALLNALSNADVAAAEKRVRDLQNKQHTLTADELAEILIKRKVQQTAAVGAASSSVGLIPGLGTLASLTVGVATDITATFKLQAEMVLELAAVYGFELSELDQQKLIFLVTGVSTGSNVLIGKVGKEISVKMTERYAQKWLSTALPFVGVAASSGTNALSTYVIAERSKAYFKDGPEAVKTWQESLRRISGFDERKIADWLKQGGEKTVQGVTNISNIMGQAVSEASSATSQAVTDVAVATGQAIATGTQKTLQTLKVLSSSTAEFSTGVMAQASKAIGKPFKKADGIKKE